METASSGLFDTHPSDKDRIARARREAPGDGIFHLDGPATDVFRDFDALAKAVSFDMYRSSLGPSISRDQLFEVAELVETQAAAQEGAVAAGRFFLGALDMSRRLPMPGEYPAAPADLSAAEAIAGRGARGAPGGARRLPRVEPTRRRAGGPARAGRAGDRAAQGRRQDQGVRLRPEGGDAAAPPSRRATRPRPSSAALDESESSDPFATAAVARLAGALGLLEDDRVAGRVPDGRDRRDEARALYRCTAHLASSVMPQLARLSRSRSVLIGALQVYEAGKDPKNQPRINAVLRAASALRDRLEETRWKVGDAIDYPFEHADEDVTLGKFAFPP